MRVNLVRDPAALEAVRPIGACKVILGLDFGTTTGAAFAYIGPNDVADRDRVKAHLAGQWDLSVGPYESGALRFVRLRHFLAAARPDFVAYEDVKFEGAGAVNLPAAVLLARVVPTAELFGAFKATACTWCEEHGVPCAGFKIGTIKKRATGRGNCNKEDMVKAANDLFGAGLETASLEATGAHNVADAMFVCLLAVEEYGKGLWEGNEKRPLRELNT